MTPEPPKIVSFGRWTFHQAPERIVSCLGKIVAAEIRGKNPPRPREENKNEKKFFAIEYHGVRTGALRCEFIGVGRLREHQ